MFYVQNILIWVSGVYEGDVHGPLYIFCLLFRKTEKVHKHDLYLNQILHDFDLKHFSLRWIIKNYNKGAPGVPAPISIWSEYSSLIDFIAILLTPGIFLIQIVDTNNTNMYLIHFQKILLTCVFPKFFF